MYMGVLWGLQSTLQSTWHAHSRHWIHGSPCYHYYAKLGRPEEEVLTRNGCISTSAFSQEVNTWLSLHSTVSRWAPPACQALSWEAQNWRQRHVPWLVAQLVRAPSCAPQDRSRSGHVPMSWDRPARSRGVRKRQPMDVSLSHRCFSLSPIPLRINKNISWGED